MNTVEEIAASLSAEQKSNLQEVAALMLEIFRTLQRMGYLEEEWIQPGPHNDAINALMPLYQSLHLDPAIIYLYSILPYIDPLVAKEVDFFDAGEFVDYRNKDDVQQWKDPLYFDFDEKNKTPPWMTPLSKVGNHTNVIFYDAKRHRVGIFESLGEVDRPEGFNTGDLNLDVGYCMEMTRDNGPRRWVKKGKDGVEVDIETAEEFHELAWEWWDQWRARGEGEPKEFEYNLDQMMVYMSRPAPDVLRDINRWFIELINVPGAEGSNAGLYWDAEVLKPLWRKHGWPGDGFDREAFLVDRQRAICREKAIYSAEEPLRKSVHKPEANQALQEAEALAARIEAANAAGNVDEKWALRWEKWWNDREYQAQKAYYEEVQERKERLCPNGECIKPSELPLWELQKTQLQMYDSQKSLRGLQSDEASTRSSGRSGARWEREIRDEKRKLSILQKAVAACEADVARLCPGKTPFPVDILGIHILRETVSRLEVIVESSRETDARVREWMGQLPGGAVRARNLAQAVLDKNQVNMEKHSKWLEGNKKHLDRREREGEELGLKIV